MSRSKITSDSTDQSVPKITSDTSAPSPVTAGDFWFDTSKNVMKVYNGTYFDLVSNAFIASGGTVTESAGYKYHTFTSSGTFSVTGERQVEVLIVAGGGGGGAGRASSSWFAGGGGGAGGLIDQNFTASNQDYSVVIGAGGTGQIAGQNHQTASGVIGGNSSVFGSTAIGGGAGGSYQDGTNRNGRSGGSGGGAGSVGSGGSGTVGQGNAGGNGTSNNPTGGGGGAGSVGGNGVGENNSGGVSGSGGSGVNWKSLGTFYAGGGGGGIATVDSYGGTPGGGGAGGGGAGSGTITGAGNSGTANTGGGGGGVGGNLNISNSGGNGGSGIVIIRYQV